MVIKRRHQPASTFDDSQVEALANELADKTYGTEAKAQDNTRLTRTSVTLPQTMHEKLEDMALENKRNQRDLKTVTSIIREAVAFYLSQQKSV